MKQEEFSYMNDLVERYVYAVTELLPKKMRSDVAAELRSLISDMIEARCSGGLADERLIKTVLRELGEPAELAGKYRGDTRNCLIGEPYFQKYVFITKLLVLSVLFGMTVAHLVIGVLESGSSAANWGLIAARWFTVSFQALTAMFSFITVFFAIIYRAGISIKMEIPQKTIENLPPLPVYNPTRDAVINCIFCVIFCAVFLVFPSVFVLTSGGASFAVFNADLLRSSWLYIIVFAALGIIREILTLVEGTYSLRLLWASIALNAASVITAVCCFARGSLINPAFLVSLNSMSGMEVNSGFFEQFGYFLLTVMCLALLLDTVKRINRTLKETRR